MIKTGKDHYGQEEVDITFNRNILVNEPELIDNCMKFAGLLPTKLILQKHPWVDNVEEAIDSLARTMEVSAVRPETKVGNVAGERTGIYKPVH